MVERVKPNKGGGSYFAAPKSNVEFIPSGCKVLDLALGGGWCERRISNIIGDKSTGKTLLCIESAANFAIKYPKGKIRYREAEAAFDEPYAQALGMPIDRVDFGGDNAFETVEDMFEDLTKIIEGAKDPELVVVDSLDALSSREEMSRAIDKGTYGQEKAKMMSQLFRRLVRQLEASNVTVLIVSQVRDNISAAAFGRKWTRSGGRALDFYCSQVIYLAKLQTLMKTVNKIKRPIGVEILAKVDKNKVALPFRQAQFEIIFGYGIDNEIACVDWLKEHGLPASWAGAKLTEIPDDKLNSVVEERWWEVEQSFLPTKRKYA